MCKNSNSKINCQLIMRQHLTTNPGCAKAYVEDNYRIIGQARSSFHLSVLESVYIKTHNTSCVDKESSFSHLYSLENNLTKGGVIDVEGLQRRAFICRWYQVVEKLRNFKVGL